MGHASRREQSSPRSSPNFSAASRSRSAISTPTRDFTYVTDTVEAFVQAGDTASAIGCTLNVGSGREIAIGDLAERIEAVIERRAPVELDPARVRPSGSEVERLCANADEARKLLGWEPRVSLDDGLAATAEWIGRNLERYRVGAYTV